MKKTSFVVLIGVQHRDYRKNATSSDEAGRSCHRVEKKKKEENREKERPCISSISHNIRKTMSTRS